MFSWKRDDAIGLYTINGTRIVHWAIDVSEDVKTSAFSSYGWSLVENANYYLYSPYNPTYFANAYPMTDLPITFDGQLQSANHRLAHISDYDFMMGQGNTSDDSADFTLNHLGAIVRIEFTSPKAAVYTGLYLSTTEEVFWKSAKMNLKTQSMSPVTLSSYTSLQLGNIGLDEGEKLEAFMVVAPVDLTDRKVTLTLTTLDGEEINMDVQANELKAGKLYLLNASEDGVGDEPNQAKRKAGSFTEPTVSAYDIPIDEEYKAITTGVSRKIHRPDTDEATYTLSGIRTNDTSVKGIFIKNGKKVIQK